MNVLHAVESADDAFVQTTGEEAVNPVSVSPANVGAAVTCTVGVVPEPHTTFCEHVSDVSGAVTSAAFGTVPDVRPAPEPTNPVPVAVMVGAMSEVAAVQFPSVSLVK